MRVARRRGLGLNLDVDNRYYSGRRLPRATFSRRSPAPGTVVRREWLVRVSESLGLQKVEVPSVVGQGEREAAFALRRVGLEVGVTARLPYGNAAEGTVIAQDPPAHAQGIARPSVNLLVAAASDDEPDGFLMPELVGHDPIERRGNAGASGYPHGGSDDGECGCRARWQRGSAASTANQAWFRARAGANGGRTHRSKYAGAFVGGAVGQSSAGVQTGCNGGVHAANDQIGAMSAGPSPARQPVRRPALPQTVWLSPPSGLSQSMR
jgi:hypothetical protein